MTIYRGVGGVNREIKQQYRGIGGVNREIKEQYRGVGGVNQKVFAKGIGGIDANTLLMLHAESFTDSSKYTNTITPNGFYIWDSGKFSKCFRSSHASMNIQNNLFTFGISDFTIDFWLNTKGLATPNNGILGQGGDYTNGIYGVCVRQQSWGNIQVWIGNGNITGCMIDIPSVPLNVWNHISIVRSGTYFYVFINGTMVGSSTGANSYSIASSNILLGSNYCDGVGSSGSYLDGCIDELRISNVARWASNFTPPAEPYS